MSAQPEDFPQALERSKPTCKTLAGTDIRLAIGRLPKAIRKTSVGADTPAASRKDLAPTVDATPWGLLSLLAETLDDLERTRIAAENRARSLAQVYELEDEPPHRQAVVLAEAIKALEHGAELQLKRALRRHPLGAWVKRTVGVGEKQGARLLAAIGDPYWNNLHDRPRTVSELWAYCGYHVLPLGYANRVTQSPSAEGSNSPASHNERGNQAVSAGGTKFDVDQHEGESHSVLVGVAARKARGSRANWSATAKMRAYLIAESCMKQAASPYRAIYDAGRTKYADATHQTECVRCGPRNAPAAIGSPLSAGHQHARALRLVAKAVLKDLWLAARELHGETQ